MQSPPRRTHVRVSVREKVENKDPDWHTTETSFQHKRYQTLESLTALSGERASELGRSTFSAEWVAVAPAQPAIQDGWRLVWEDENGDPQLFLDVEKRLPSGRKQRLMLSESGPVQS